MAPTCYNNVKNHHYRYHSMPESVYANQHLDQRSHGMIDMLGHSEYHMHHPHMQKIEHKIHTSNIMKKRNALRRSQTSVCDLVLPGGYQRAPLASGVYEAFLPHPNLNAIGLPLGSSVTGSCSIRRSYNRPQSLYMSSNHYRSVSASLSQHRLNYVGSQHDLHRTDYRGSPYGLFHMHPFANQSDLGISSEEKLSQWYYRSQPNMNKPVLPPSNSATTPLFVDCSVEYDLGEQPTIPADSEPLLRIHPDYVSNSVITSPPRSNKNSSASNKTSQAILHSQDKRYQDFLKTQQKSTSHLGRQQCATQLEIPSNQIPHKMSGGEKTPDSNINPKHKIEPTRKLSVESGDSGIGIMNSTGNINNMAVKRSQWLPSDGCDPKIFSTMTTQSSDLKCQLESLPNQQTEFTGRVLPTTSKPFGISDLVSGLFCCSAPSYPQASFTGALQGTYQQSSGGQQEGWGSQHHQFHLSDKLGAKQEMYASTDSRTVEWVVQNQRLMNQCRGGFCGRDCGDGFCNNVWKNMVQV